MKYLAFILLLVAPAVFAAKPADPVPPKPEGIDLDVTVIERTPRYPNYYAKYEKRSTQFGIHPDQKDVAKRWPANGEVVTLIGRIANKGTEPAPAFEYAWLLDGKIYGKPGRVSGLKPGEYKAVTMKWRWVMEPHVIELVVDPYKKIKETFEQNNRLAHDTLAKLMHLKVSHDTYRRMNSCPNLAGTYSCEDQLNWHMDLMNDMFKNAIYPSLPNGSRERVRAEFLFVENKKEFQKWYDERGGSSMAGYDGGWWHDYSDKTAQWCQKIDWGLPHELGHQLGIIDLYRLDLGTDRNLAPDEDGDPVMIGRNCDMIGMMRTHGPLPWSEHTALATDTHFTKRRGFYGVYLVAMPEKVYIQLLDNKGYPFPGAKITAYQTGDSGVSNKVVFQGMTGRDGRFLLPNRSIGQPRHITELGYEYHDNPFGPVNIVGGNAVLFFRIQARGHIEYQWLEITHLNLAYWRGHRNAYSHVYRTHIPHSAMPPAPKNVIAEQVSEGVKITWQKVPDAPAIARARTLSPNSVETTKSTNFYRIWRAYPSAYKWEEIGTRNDRDSAEFIDKDVKPGMVRYAVTSVNTSRNESGFSRYYGYSVLAKPTGICAAPNGRLILADGEGGLNALIYLKPSGSTIGPWNSVHCHSYSRDVAIAKDGMVAFTDWPDGYDPDHVGFWLRKWNTSRKRTAVKKERGSGPDQIAEPRGISFDDKGNVIITDSGNNRVDCYTRKGKRLWRVDEVDVEGEGTLKDPSRAVIWRGRLAIADTGNNRVVLARIEGREKEIVLTGLKSPRYLAVDRKDRLIVSDTGNGALKVYNFSDKGPELISTFTGTDDKKITEPVGVTDIGNGTYAIVDYAGKTLLFVTEKELVYSPEETACERPDEPRQISLADDGTHRKAPLAHIPARLPR